MENQSISRVHYYERQFLRTTDFTDEQAYHLGMLRRHQIAEHSWGIVRGLELALSQDSNPVLEPGIAVDGYGRTLVWQFQQPLPVQEFDARGSNKLDVWLAYNELKTNDSGTGAPNCATSDAGDEAYNRIQEQPILLMEPPDPTHPDPRLPPGVSEGDLDFDGTQNPPQSPEVYWPVYLGQVLRKREKPDQPWQYSVSLDKRPYAGLVGEMVKHPTGNAWLEIGTPVAEDSQETRFAVFLNDPRPSGAQPDEIDSLANDPDPRLEITSAGQINLRGDASLNGNLILEAGALALRAQKEVSTLILNDPTNPRPWTLYRTQGVLKMRKTPEPQPVPAAAAVPLGEAGAAQPAQDETTSIPTNDLRLEMAGKTNGANQVVIGAWGKGPDGKEAFQPCLTIDDDCNVTIERNLIVRGFITKLPDDGASGVSAGALNMMLGAYATTAAANTGQLQQLYAGQFGITPQMLVRLLESVEGRRALLEALFPDPTLREAFIKALLDFDDNGLTGQEVILTELRNDPARVLAAIDYFIESADSLRTMVTELLGSSDGVAELVKQLVGSSSALDDVLTKILTDNNALNTLIDKVIKLPSGWQSLVDRLLLDESALKKVLDGLLQDTDGPDRFADTIQNAVTAGSAFMDALLASDLLMEMLANQLKNDPAPDTRINALGSKIKAALVPGSPQWTAFIAALS